MQNKTKIFVDELVSIHHDKILSVEILGSRIGEQNLNISDIDILILCKHKSNKRAVFNSAQKILTTVFGIKTSKINKFIQFYLLASNSFKGIHLITISKDEFTEELQPKSFRLKLLSKLIGTNLFLYEIKENHTLLYGLDFSHKINIELPPLSEKFSCFLFPILILILSLPVYLISHNSFKIWCFKVIKYHYNSLNAYFQISKSNLLLSHRLIDTANKYRYLPEEYTNSPIVLYFKIWKFILFNLRYF